MREKLILKVPEDIIYAATHEHLAGQTIGIFDEKNGGIGTGTGIKINGQSVIVTAGHVLDGMALKNMAFTLRGKESLNIGALTNRFHVIRRDAEAIKLPVLESIIIDRPRDLGFVILDTNFSSECIGLEFLDMTDVAETTPADVELSPICGFPEQLVQQRHHAKNIEISVGLYIDHPRLIADPGNLDSSFNAKLHFLLQFPEDEVQEKITMLSRLKGMSGASPRQIIKNVPGEVWKIRTKIIGIQTGVYPGRIYKCTRSEILLQELHKLFGVKMKKGGRPL